VAVPDVMSLRRIERRGPAVEERAEACEGAPRAPSSVSSSAGWSRCVEAKLLRVTGAGAQRYWESARWRKKE
jgi:hypothetical protein